MRITMKVHNFIPTESSNDMRKKVNARANKKLLIIYVLSRSLLFAQHDGSQA